MSPDVASKTGSLRTGWTTGTCASAAAKAATIGLLEGRAPTEIEVGLPSGDRVSFPVETDGVANQCAIVKDAGDDPDCTDGARMTARVELLDGGETVLRGGDGIGTVTLPGLGLEVGAPAINPVPRRMILAAVAEVTAQPLDITFSVPGGDRMALKTSNDRLGIVGGISILGTSGIVKPFSTASYRASVVQQIDVAAAQGSPAVALSTGTRSDRAAQRELGELAPVAFVEVGDFTGIALRHAAGAGIDTVHFVGMAGKIAKLAAGVMMTHFHRSQVDTALLAEVAREAGASDEVVASAEETTTARHFYEQCMVHGTIEPLRLLCERATEACAAHTGDAIDVSVTMVDFEGDNVITRAERIRG